MNKTFCVLEQGCSIEQPETLRRKEEFTTGFSDFYRLNWKTGKDHIADVYAPGTVWSEGRSLLFEHVPKNYDYYIFIDDDAVFSTESTDGIAREIKRILGIYCPLSGTFLISSQRGAWFLNYRLDRSLYADKDAFMIAGFDLCVHIFHRSFAEAMFPVIYHGSGKCMWYAQWVCHTLFPKKQLCFTTVTYNNSRSVQHEDATKPAYTPPQEVVRRFNQSVIHPSKVWNHHKQIQELNMQLLRDHGRSNDNRPCHNEVDFSLDNLATVYDIRNPAFRSRSARSKAKAIREGRSYLPLKRRRRR